MKQLEIQLEFLKQELTTLNDTIARFDTITQSVKNWSILLWSASISFAMSREEGLRNYVIFTSIIPLAFWYIDARWRRTQRQMIFRVGEISEFLNGSNLQKSIELGKITGINILDVKSKKSEDQESKWKFATIKKTMFFKTVFIFYVFQITTSLLIGVVTIFSVKI